MAVRFDTIDEMRKCYAKYTATKSNGGYGYCRVANPDMEQLSLSL